MSLLGHEEFLSLLKKAQSGEQDALETIVAHNVALVKSIVKKFLGRGVEFDDLYQIGCLGLVKSIRNFSSEYGVRFSTYAVPMIAGEIKRFMRDDGIIKVSRSLKETAAKASITAEQLSRQMTREPTVTEIAEAMGIEPEELTFALEASRGCLSLHEPLFEDDSVQLMDSISHDDGSDVFDSILLKEMIGSLEPRERQLIVMRYFQDRTQSEIAREMGVSQVQVSRMESRIIQKMKQSVVG